MNRRKLIGLIASLVAAAIGTFAILQYSKGKPAPVAAPVEPMVTVLQVTKDIPKGTPAGSLAEYITPTQVPVSAKQPNAASDVGELANLVANSDLFAGDQLSKVRFSTPGQATAPTAQTATATGTPDANNGLIGVWVNIGSIQALNGKFTPGVTKVAVFAEFTTPVPGLPGDPTAAVPANHLIIHHAPILDVWPPIASVVGSPATTVAPAAGVPVPPAPTFQIKLGVDAPSAERLIYAATNGTIYLGEEPDSAPSDAPTKIIERGNIYVPTAPVVPIKTSIIATADATTPTTVPLTAAAKAAAAKAAAAAAASTATTLKPGAAVGVTPTTLVKAGAVVTTLKPGTVGVVTIATTPPVGAAKVPGATVPAVTVPGAIGAKPAAVSPAGP